MKNVMIDLETMSTEKHAAILSIGAVVFEPEEEKIVDIFYQNVTLSSCVKMGMHRSQSTLEWWSKDENKTARDSLTRDAIDIDPALVAFIKWCNGDIIPWSNGATFDIVILENAMKYCNRPVPWKFYNESCYRTLKRLYPEVILLRTGGIKHNALHDATYQARHLMRILYSLQIREETLR